MLNHFIAQVKDWSFKSLGLASVSAASHPKSGMNTASLILISQEDIYRNAPNLSRPVLLLRKGQEVSALDLPRLIQGGVQPQQFRFKETPSTMPKSPAHQEVPGLQTATAPRRSPELVRKDVPETVACPNRPFRPISERRHETVLLLEEDPKDLKRLIDCLFVCGFDLNRIFPLRRPAHLGWAMERHQPDILIASRDLLTSAMELNPDLNAVAFPKRLILTVDASLGNLPFSMGSNVSLPWSGLAESSPDMIDLQGGLSAQILRKPFSRFAMKNLLNISDSNLDDVMDGETAAIPILKSRPFPKARLKLG